MPDTTPEVEDPVAKVRAELAAYEAENAPKPPPSKDKADPKAAETKTEANATPGGSGSVSAGESADAANAGESPAPESEEPVDLSWAPDSVKQEIEKAKLSKAALNALKSGFMGRKEITQRFQEIAAVKRDADNWRAATSDPEKAKRIVDILTRQDEPAPVAEPEVDAAQFDPLDPVSVAKFTAAQAAKVAAAEARKAVGEFWKEKVEGPLSRKNAVNAAISQFAQDNGVEASVTQAAVNSMLATWPEGVPLSPELVPALLAPHVEVAKMRAASAPKKQTNGATGLGGKGGLSEVASPSGRAGTAAGSTIPIPAFVRENRAPETDEEIEEGMRYAIAKRYGPDVLQGQPARR